MSGVSKLVRVPPEEIVTATGESAWRISLGGDRFALISPEDLAKVAPHTWRINQRGYVVRTCHSGLGAVRRTVVQGLHRYVLDAPRGVIVDHADGDLLNNQRGNLRFASHQQNSSNRHRSVNQLAGRFKGVTWHKNCRKWQAQIKVSGKEKYLGLFYEAEDAARAYDRAAREHFGEFSVLNFPDSERRSA